MDVWLSKKGRLLADAMDMVTGGSTELMRMPFYLTNPDAKPEEQVFGPAPWLLEELERLAVAEPDSPHGRWLSSLPETERTPEALLLRLLHGDLVQPAGLLTEYSSFSEMTRDEIPDHTLNLVMIAGLDARWARVLSELTRLAKWSYRELQHQIDRSREGLDSGSQLLGAANLEETVM